MKYKKQALNLSLLLFAAILLRCPASANETVEQIVAVVNEHLIFLSDLRRDHLFFENGADASLQKQIGHRINHQLLLNEAKRFVLDPPSTKEIDQGIKAISHRFKNEGEFQTRLKENGMALEELREEVANRLLIKTFLQDRIGFFIFVTDEEIDQYYEKHPGDFKGISQKNRTEQIQSILKADKEKIKIDEYIAQIKSRATVQINVQ